MLKGPLLQCFYKTQSNRIEREQKDLYIGMISMANNLSMLSKRMNLKLGSLTSRSSSKREIVREQNLVASGSSSKRELAREQNSVARRVRREAETRAGTKLTVDSAEKL